MKMIMSADTLAAASLILVTTLALGWSWLRPVAISQRVTREGGTVFLSQKMMHHGYSLVQPLVRALAGARVSPDAISWFALFLGMAAGWAVGTGRLGCGGWLFALSGLGDMLDGAVARERGCAHAGGAVLDSVLDRYVEAFFLSGLLVYFKPYIELQVLCMAALLGSFMVTYSTAKAEALGLTPPRGWMKRPERMVWCIYGAAASALVGACGGTQLGVMASVIALIAFFSHLSALQRLRSLQRHASGL